MLGMNLSPSPHLRPPGDSNAREDKLTSERIALPGALGSATRSTLPLRHHLLQYGLQSPHGLLCHPREVSRFSVNAHCYPSAHLMTSGGRRLTPWR